MATREGKVRVKHGMDFTRWTKRAPCPHGKRSRCRECSSADWRKSRYLNDQLRLVAEQIRGRP